MFSIGEALALCKQEELVRGKMVYTDKVPYSSEDIADNNEKKCLLKALEGLVSQEDNRNNNANISGLLMKYIFNDAEAETMQIDDEDVNNLIEIRLIADAESKYIERLDKLLFRTYFEKGRYELEGLVYEMYDKYAWVKSLIEKYAGDKTIIFREKSLDYNEKFGIYQQEDNDSRMPYNTSSCENTETNWILRKFGG